MKPLLSALRRSAQKPAAPPVAEAMRRGAGSARGRSGMFAGPNLGRGVPDGLAHAALTRIAHKGP